MINKVQKDIKIMNDKQSTNIEGNINIEVNLS